MKLKLENIIDDMTYWHDDHLCISSADKDGLISQILQAVIDFIEAEKALHANDRVPNGFVALDDLCEKLKK
jgi:hypothetical protein